MEDKETVKAEIAQAISKNSIHKTVTKCPDCVKKRVALGISSDLVPLFDSGGPLSPLACDFCGIIVQGGGQNHEQSGSGESGKVDTPITRALRSIEKVEATRCPKCKKLLSTSSLRKHIEAVHFPKKHEQECRLCGKSFKNKKNLTQHKKSVRHRKNLIGGASDSPFCCSMCSYGAATFHQLKKHQKIAHEQRYITQKYTSCPYQGCGKMISALKAHIKTAHIEKHENIK